jgi:hypothetical protein
VAVGSVNGHAAVFVGGRGAWLIAHRFAIGGGGMALVNDVEGPTLGGTRHDVRMGHGGIWFESAFSPMRRVHLNAGVLVGVGSASLSVSGSGERVEDDAFFVVEPSLLAELNLGPSVRAQLGGTWRLVQGLELTGVSSSDLSGPTAVLVLKFGSF